MFVGKLVMGLVVIKKTFLSKREGTVLLFYITFPEQIVEEPAAIKKDLLING